MKSRKVNRFLAILGACAICITSMPLTANATESVSENTVETEEVATPEPTALADDIEVEVEESKETPTATPEASPTATPEAEEIALDEESGDEELTSDTEESKEIEAPVSIVTSMANSVTENIVSTMPNAVTANSPAVQVGASESASDGIAPLAEIGAAAKIEVDEQSGKNAYHAIASEFTVPNAFDDHALITGFTPTLSQSYDLIVVPGEIEDRPVQIGTDFLTAVSKLGKGIIIESGATLVTSAPNLNVTYVRFEDGAMAKSAAGTFKGWDDVTSVIGFGEALAAGGATEVNFSETFSGCRQLRNIEVDIADLPATFDKTFYGITNIGTIRILNGSVNSVSLLNWHKCQDTAYADNNCTITFSNITFPDDESSYFENAFTNVDGSVIFNNCTPSALNFDKACANSSLINYDNDYDDASNLSMELGSAHHSSRTIGNITITGATAHSAKSMFESSSLRYISLDGFITTDTVAVDSMFKGATFGGLVGVDTWRLGAATADEMFNSTRVYFGPNAYLTQTLIPQLKRLDWSQVTSANKLFNWTYKGNAPIDYSGMNLSSVTDMTVSSLADFDFITPAQNPQNFVFSQDRVYELRGTSYLQGKALDPIDVVDGKIAGSDIKTNTHIYTDIATITLTDVATDTEVSTVVVPGYKLSDYLDAGHSYYQDRSLTQRVSMDLVVSTGDTVNIYYQGHVSGVTEDLINGAEVDFGDDLEDVEITMSDGSKDKLVGGNADVSIKIENSTGSKDMVIPTVAAGFAKSQYFNIDLIATISGSNKKVTEIDQKVTVTLPLPNDYTSGDVKILNYHDGYNSAPIVLNATVDTAAKTVTFETDKFSPYVELYDDSVETDAVDVNVVWSGDTKDKTGRKNFDIGLTVNYKNGSKLELTQEFVASTSNDSGKVTFEYPITYGGSEFQNYDFASTNTISVDGYYTSWDVKTYTYTLNYSGSNDVRTVTFTVDYTGVSDADFAKYLNMLNADDYKKGNQSISLYWVYDDGSSDHDLANISPVAGTRVYTADFDVCMKTSSGKTFDRFTDISFNGDGLATSYDSVVDLDNFKISRVAKAEDSTQKNNYNFVVKVIDNNNASGDRPERLTILFTATFGSYTRTKTVEINLKGITGNVANGTVEFPVSVGGVTMTKLDAAELIGASNYSSTWDSGKLLFKYQLDGAEDTEPDPTVIIDKQMAYVEFVNDTATARPQKVTLTLVDSNNQNPVVKEIATVFNAQFKEYGDYFQPLVNDTYHIQSVSGIDATKWKVDINGLKATLTLLQTQVTPTTPVAKRTVKITMDDGNNEAGLRPKSMKITVANSSGSDSVTSEITVGSENTFSYEVDVNNTTDEYTVKSVSGLPEKYEVTISGLNITCKYTPEKIEKTYKVEWTDDADNADKTRPSSVTITVKNSGNTITTVTVSESTNWTANATLPKYQKGVEASYSIEGADVSNYSKSVSGDTVTYKFTGTLSKDAQDKLAAAASGTNGTDGTAEVKEPDYSIDNFDWIDYANRYPDLKKAYGYNKEALYAHYIRYGIGEGRVATFTGKYNTVNEDILAAYFPDDYKYKTDLSTVGEEYLIGKDKTTTTATSTGNKVTVDEDGNIHTVVKNSDGTTTETVTDADGNIISVSTYKTGDLRLEDMSVWFVVLGVILLAIAGFIVFSVIRDDKRKKSVLSMIS